MLIYLLSNSDNNFAACERFRIVHLLEGSFGQESVKILSKIGFALNINHLNRFLYFQKYWANWFVAQCRKLLSAQRTGSSQRESVNHPAEDRALH